MISEILAAPREAFALEWVELFNPGSVTIRLEGWQLDDANDGSAHALEGSIAPGAYLVIQLPRAILNNSGDTVRLLGPDGGLVDSFRYATAASDLSFARTMPNGEWQAGHTPSPGQASVAPDTLAPATHTPTDVSMDRPNPADESPSPVDASTPQPDANPSGESGLPRVILPSATWPAEPGSAPTYAAISAASYSLHTPTPPNTPMPEPPLLPAEPSATAIPAPLPPQRSPWLALGGLALIALACLGLIIHPEREEE